MKNIGTVFLLTDAQIPDEKFLVLINDLLASGEIPDLFGGMFHNLTSLKLRCVYVELADYIIECRKDRIYIVNSCNSTKT